MNLIKFLVNERHSPHCGSHCFARAVFIPIKTALPTLVFYLPQNQPIKTALLFFLISIEKVYAQQFLHGAFHRIGGTV